MFDICNGVHWSCDVCITQLLSQSLLFNNDMTHILFSKDMTHS